MGCLWASYFPETTRIHFIVKPNHPWLQDPTPTLTCLPNKRQIAITPVSIADIDRSNINTSEHRFPPIERLIVTTKAYDCLTALTALKPHITESTRILLLQNGMGSQQQVAQAFNTQPVYAVSSTEGAYKVDQQTFFHAGFGENTVGPLTENATLADLSHWLPSSAYQWREPIEPVLWQKLMINAAINPLTVKHQCKNGALLTSRKAHEEFTAVCQELDQLNHKLSVPIHSVYDIAKNVAIKTENNFSSMYQDVHHHRQTEIDFITGYIIQMANDLQLEMPTNKALLDTVRQISP